MSAHFGKRVLVIDSDAHASISNMLIAPDWLETIQQQRRTIVDYLITNVLHGAATNWRAFLTGGVSDVDDATSIDLMAGGGHLTLFEREVSKSGTTRWRCATRCARSWPRSAPPTIWC